MAVAFNGKHLAKFIRPEEYEAIYPQVELAHKQLEAKTGFGNDFLSSPASKRPHRRSVRIPMCCSSLVSAVLIWAPVL